MIDKFACFTCGEFSWTSNDRGCRKCGSSEIYIIEDDDYESEEIWKFIVDDDTDPHSAFFSSLEHPEVIQENVNFTIVEINRLKSEFRNEKLDLDTKIANIKLAVSSVLIHDERISSMINSGIRAYYDMQFQNAETAHDGNIKLSMHDQKIAEIDNDHEYEFDGILLSMIKGNIISKEIIPRTTHIRNQEGVNYSVIPNTHYHINIKETIWDIAKDSAKVVPFIIALCKLQMPLYGGLIAIGELIKKIIENVYKLDVANGELCVYNSISTYSKTQTQYPSNEDLVGRLVHLEDCTCKFATNVTPEDSKSINEIISFLISKNVIEEVHAGKFNVVL